MISPLEIINVVKPYLKLAEANDAAEALVLKAKKLWSKFSKEIDDITVIVIFVVETVLNKI